MLRSCLLAVVRFGGWISESENSACVQGGILDCAGSEVWDGDIVYIEDSGALVAFDGMPVWVGGESVCAVRGVRWGCRAFNY